MNQPDSIELDTLLNNLQPRTTLDRLGAGEVPPALGLYRAMALIDLDRFQEAREQLEPLETQLAGDDLARAGALWATLYLERRAVDGAVMSAQHAARVAETDAVRAQDLAISALGYAGKQCWNLAETVLRQAIELAPNDPRVLAAQAHFRLEADQRLEARALYERLGALDSVWAKATADWGRGYVAYLLGEFEQAQARAAAALQYSAEIVFPLHLLAQLALVREDASALQDALDQIARRSPQADTLAHWQEQLARLQARSDAPRRRLHAFPSTVQRRDYCGPSTIELVLRYWQGGLDLTNDQIAEKTKFPHGGTPTYRLREFFHLVNFDTLRCPAPVDQLKQLVDAGYPVIVEEEFSTSAHVAVVIGYDDAAGLVELQDPANHAITVLTVDELERLRRPYLDSAVVAFPRGQGHDKALARLDLFNDPALVGADQAALALDQERYPAAADLAESAAHKQPNLHLAWRLWLEAELALWRAAPPAPTAQPGGMAARLAGQRAADDPVARRARFYDTLAQAQTRHPDAEFVFQFQGAGAVLDGDWDRALAAYQRAVEIDPDDPRNQAALAECLYALRRADEALETARTAIARDTALPAANVWLARCHAYFGQDLVVAQHYAESAVELAPNWWLAHLARGEVYLKTSDYGAASREAGVALSLAPDQPEALVLHAIANPDYAAALTEIEATLAGPRPLSPMVQFQAHQTACRILFGAQVFDAAIEQAQAMLAALPNDPWALQFLAAAHCEAAIQARQHGDAAVIARIQQLYEPALTANNGTPWMVADYLRYLAALAGPAEAVAAAARLRETYPDHGDLVYQHGWYQSQAGQTEPAAQTMLEALARPAGLQDADELYLAVRTILAGLGLEAGEAAVLAAPVPEQGAQLSDRERALGLLLARYPEERGDRARELLTAAVARDPHDALAVLRLGDVTATEAEREALYRRALLLDPAWAYARATLAHHLVDQDRPAEALEFTAGHEGDSPDVRAAHARALQYTGRYEEAAAAAAQAIAESDAPEPWFYNLQWRAERDAGRPEAAVAAARQALALFPDDAAWHLNLARSLRGLGRLDEAAQVIAQGQALGLSEADVLEEEYEAAIARWDLAAALAAIEQLVAAEAEKPGDGALGWWEKKRLYLLAELGRLDEARQVAEAEGLDAEGWGEAAWAVLDADANALALEFAERALALDPESYEGLYCRAQALEDLGRAEEAMTAFHALRQAHPSEHNAYEKLAHRLAVDGEPGQLDEALALAERAVELGSFCDMAWGVRGYVRFVRGERAAALADLQACWNRADVRRRHKGHFEWWWLLAALQGDDELAAQHQARALAEARTAFNRRMIAQIEALLALDLAHEQDARLRGPDHLAALAALDAAYPAIRAVWEAAVAAGNWALVRDLADALNGYFEHRQRWDEWLAWTQAGLAACQRLGDEAGAAALHNRLGDAYRTRPTGDRTANVQQAIACYQEALRFYTPEAAPLNYAHTQGCLGAAYRNLPTGDRTANVQQAIARYQEALRFYTPEADPVGYAWIQNNLGLAYQNLPGGDRAANLERAIACYQEALRFRTPEAAPLDYALTQNNLGSAYADLPTGDRAANLKKAIECYREALRFRTPEADPRGYAEAHNNLGNAYADLPTGDRAANLKKAIECYREALRFRTPEAAPLDYAQTQNNLGLTYVDLAELLPGNRAAHLDQALICYREALRFYTPEAAPEDYAWTTNNLGVAYMRRPEYEQALATFRQILAVNPEFYVAYYNTACTHALLGPRAAAEACAWLERAIALNEEYREWLRDDPDFDGIREEPCFQALANPS